MIYDDVIMMYNDFSWFWLFNVQWFLMIFDYLWWCTMIYDDFLMIYDDYMMIYDYFMMIFSWFTMIDDDLWSFVMMNSDDFMMIFDDLRRYSLTQAW